MDEFVGLVQSIIPSFDEEWMSVEFSEAGIDSMDLVTLRVLLEKKFGQVVPDSLWLKFRTLSEVLGFYNQNANSGEGMSSISLAEAFRKEIVVNMPQMAVEALSESWLFKEIGGVHWDMLCNGLGRKSFDLKDDVGNRLYATFIRIRLDCTGSLFDFKENENLMIQGRINRFGNSMYHSMISIDGHSATINAELLTSFSIRNDSDNSKLVKSQPSPGTNLIDEYDTIPHFANEYRLMKKRELKSVSYKGLEFSIAEDAIFETEYSINPFYELNGVGLLYFAAYPIINDTCTAQYFNEGATGFDRWEQSYYTVTKDVFYYANCNIDETIVFKLHEAIPLDGGKVKLSSTLYRKSDASILAKIFSIKQKVERT